MNPPFPLSSFRRVLLAGFITSPLWADEVSAQPLAEALDTPGLNWISEGPVEAVTGTESSFDGVDAVRLNPDAASTSWPVSQIRLDLTQPSIVTFRHRSRDLGGTAKYKVFSNGDDADPPAASFWKEERLTVLPGLFQIANWESPGGNPLYIDTVSVTPAVTVPLSEALDAPGMEFSFPNPDFPPVGIADAIASPDGTDAVWLPEQGELSTVINGPAVVSFTGTATVKVVPAAPDSPAPAFEAVIGGRRQFAVPSGPMTVVWRRDGGTGIVDQLQISPEMSLAQALDAPGLVFEKIPLAAYHWISGVFATAMAPAGAVGGHAVALQPGQLTVRNLNGPGVLRFSRLGSIHPESGQSAPGLPAESTDWVRDEVTVPSRTVNLTLTGAGWLDDISWVPGGPDLALLMGQAGAAVTLADPAKVAARAEPVGTPDTMGLGLVSWYEPGTVSTPMLKIACQGPAMVSFARVPNSELPSHFTADSGSNIAAADSLAPERAPEFAVIFPNTGAHAVNINTEGVYSRLKVQPLVEVPLAEALDAPDLTFSTSPATPWRGYQTGEALGSTGGHAASGGVHATGADPWIETEVTGPGILRFSMARTATGPADSTGEFALPLKVTVDGGTAILRTSVADKVSEVFIPAGRHAARWTQHGSQVVQGKGTLSWLDHVSFTAAPAIPLSGALESGTRDWVMTNAADGLTPASWPADAFEGNSVIFSPGTGSAPSLSTIVERPCFIRFSGMGLRVSTPEGDLTLGGPDDWTTRYLAVPGIGPGPITFSAQPGKCAVLDRFAALTRLPLTDTGASTWGTNPVWHFISRSMDWLGNLDNPSDPTLLTPETGSSARHYLEATVTSPCSFSPGSPVQLPDLGMRTANRRLLFAGPRKVLLEPYSSLGSDLRRNVISAVSTRPGIPLGTATGAPGLTWETGGDVPWMGETSADGTPLWAVTGDLAPGERSWIETRVTGPAVLRWRAVPPDTASTGVAYTLMWNGLPVSGPPAAGYLHLPAGEQRIRWQLSANISNISQSSQELTLAEVAVEPAPSPSLQEFTGLAEMAFLCQQGLLPAKGPLPAWSSLTGWSADTVEGRSVLRISAPLSVMPVPARPGDFTVVAKTEGQANGSSFTLAPYPWLPKTIAAPRAIPTASLIATAATGSATTLPAGALLLVDSVEFAGAEEVSLAEALDTPDLVWTAGSTGAAVWQGFSGHGAGQAADPDAAHCRGLGTGETAWLQTQITGPAKVNVTGDVAVDDVPGFKVEMDGQISALPLRGSLTSNATTGFSVPAGSHSVRLLWRPVLARSGGLTVAISNVSVVAETGTDIGSLVEAPELFWQSANAALAAETADTFQGGDALKITPAPVRPTLTTTVQGPGVLSARIKGTAYVQMDDTSFNAGGSSYTLTEIPVPNGSHVIQFGTTLSAAILLDAVRFQSLPALSAPEALDTASLGALTPEASSGSAAAGFTQFSRDGVDSLVLYPGASRRVMLPVPVPSKISFYVKALTSGGSLQYGDKSTFLSTSTWTKVLFESDTALIPGGQLGLRAVNSPVLIDNVTIEPTAGDFYLTWAAAFGLSGSDAALNADPDGDGIGNLLEQTFGMDPTKRDSAVPAGGTSPFLRFPVISTGADPLTGDAVMEMSYWKRFPGTALPSATAYVVETSDDPSVGWKASGAPISTVEGPENGWTRMLWRSPSSMKSKPRDFVRLRIHAN